MVAPPIVVEEQRQCLVLTAWRVELPGNIGRYKLFEDISAGYVE